MAFTPEQEAFLIEFADRELKLKQQIVINREAEELERIKAAARDKFVESLIAIKNGELEAAIAAYDAENK